MAGLAAVLEVAGEALDVDAADIEQPVVVLPAPGGELAQIEGVGVAGEAAVAGQEPEQSSSARRRTAPVGTAPGSGGSGHGPQPPCSRGRRPRPQRSKRPQPVEPATLRPSPGPPGRRIYAVRHPMPSGVTRPFGACSSGAERTSGRCVSCVRRCAGTQIRRDDVRGHSSSGGLLRRLHLVGHLCDNPLTVRRAPRVVLGSRRGQRR